MINEASATASPAALYTFPCGLGLALVTHSCLPAGPRGLGALALPDHSSWGWAGDAGGTGRSWEPEAGVAGKIGAGLEGGDNRTDPHPRSGRNSWRPLWHHFPCWPGKPTNCLTPLIMPTLNSVARAREGHAP